MKNDTSLRAIKHDLVNQVHQYADLRKTTECLQVLQ
jgi:hypothetical protein